MPEGLKNAPATFQRLMDQVLRGLQGTENFVYLDDIVVYTKNLEDHGKKIRRLFNRLADAKLSLQPSKCEFFENRSSLFRSYHRARRSQTRPQQDQGREGISLVLKILKNIRQFLGLAGLL